ncbi:MAG: arylsulfatase [Bacteroidota bacterium]
MPFKNINCLLFFFGMLSGCQTQTDTKSNVVTEAPNVIIILADDQGYGDVGSHGNSIIQTPHLDGFAKNAVEVTNFHVGTTCTPTRAGLMTGRNANRNNAWHTIAGCSILNRKEETMAEVFQKNGYQTTMIGKWHLGDNYPYRPQDRGFQNTFYCQGGGVWQTPDYWLNDYFDDIYMRNGAPEKVEGYCTDVWFSETINYIDQQKDKAEPFFVYLAPNAAHAPFNVPSEYIAKYKDADLTPTLKRFYGMVTNLDDNFGQLLAYLDDHQLADNTVVIYTTDNGTAGGIHTDQAAGKKYGYNAELRGQKGSHYDGGHRVPFYIRYPNGQLNKGQKSNELVAHVDLLPTLSALCGLNFQPKLPLDGINRVTQLTKMEKDTTRLLVIDTQRNQWPKKGRNACVMSRDWRLVNGNELYHTTTDPSQKVDVSSQHPERVQQMQQFYDQWWNSTEKDWHYAHILIGDKATESTIITVHDLHTEELLNWNQQQIRLAKDNPTDGYYTIEVAEAGDYSFSISRYPPKSGLAFNATAKPQPAKPNNDGFAEGKVLVIKEVQIEYGAVSAKQSVEMEGKSVMVIATLPKGKGQLKSWFVLENGEKIPAYYTLIRKV